jgi:ribonuclease HII
MRIGADEAGKGPVLGPMVAAAIRAPAGELPDGVADSKRLSPARREALAATLRGDDAIAVGVGVVPVDRIDAPETDMNTLTVEAQVRAIAAVTADGDEALVDAGDVNESRFGRRVREGVAETGVSIDVQAEHGADDEHAVVAAASVVAKVERDRRVDDLGADYDRPLGSGYPSDPTTRGFLREYVREHGALPACARESWQTCADVLAAAEQSSLGEF